MQKQLHALVSGQVQGVGFRHFVYTRIRQHAPDVSGWVRNLYDGRVELLAEGPEDQLRTVEGILEQGPSRGLVDDVLSHWSEPGGELGPGFDVRSTARNPRG